MPVSLTCEECGEDFSVTPSRSDQIFCSRECRAESRRAEISCENCGDAFTVAQSYADDRKYCSVECKSEASRSRETLICEWCGGDYTVIKSRAETSRFCSSSCAMSKRNSKEKISLSCENCDEEYTVIPSNEDSRFCSMECKHENGRVQLACENCGDNFTEIKARKNESKFCSSKCRREFYGGFVKCENCGDDFRVNKYRLENENVRFCSRDCMDEDRTNTVSDVWNYVETSMPLDCWGWNGSVDRWGNPRFNYRGSNRSALFLVWEDCFGKPVPEDKILDKSCENKMCLNPSHMFLRNYKKKRNIKTRKYEKWRKSVFEQDDYTCQVCGDDGGGNLNAHHLNGWFVEPDERYDLSNGITLCESCHTEFHQNYGWDDATREDFKKFKISKIVGSVIEHKV